MYTVENFPTKKALIRAVTMGQTVDTWTPRIGLRPVTDGTISLEGPHYPASHSWYASAQIVSGIIVPGSIT